MDLEHSRPFDDSTDSDPDTGTIDANLSKRQKQEFQERLNVVIESFYDSVDAIATAYGLPLSRLRRKARLRASNRCISTKKKLSIWGLFIKRAQATLKTEDQKIGRNAQAASERFRKLSQVEKKSLQREVDQLNIEIPRTPLKDNRQVNRLYGQAKKLVSPTSA